MESRLLTGCQIKAPFSTLHVWERERGGWGSKNEQQLPEKFARIGGGGVDFFFLLVCALQLPPFWGRG